MIITKKIKKNASSWSVSRLEIGCNRAIDEKDKNTMLGKNTLSAPALKKAKNSQRKNTVILIR